MSFRVVAVASLLGHGAAFAEAANEPPSSIEQVLVTGNASVAERLNGVGSATDDRRRDAAPRRTDTYIRNDGARAGRLGVERFRRRAPDGDPLAGVHRHRRVRRIPVSRERRADPAGRLLQHQQSVRDQFRTGGADRSAARRRQCAVRQQRAARRDQRGDADHRGTRAAVRRRRPRRLRRGAPEREHDGGRTAAADRRHGRDPRTVIATRPGTTNRRSR